MSAEPSPSTSTETAAAAPAGRGETSRLRGKGPLVASFLLWQGTWFVAILGAARGWPVGTSVAVAALVLGALALRGALLRELPLVAAAAALGFARDSALVLAGWLDFPAEARFAGPSTIWMALLWSNLAAHTGPGTAFGWLAGRRALLAGIGLTSGPLAYYGGAKLGAVTFGENPWPGLSALAVIWTVGFPGLYELRKLLVRTPTSVRSA